MEKSELCIHLTLQVVHMNSSGVIPFKKSEMKTCEKSYDYKGVTKTTSFIPVIRKITRIIITE